MKILAFLLLLVSTAAFGFDPKSLEDKEVLKTGICDIEGKDELAVITGTHVCVLVKGDENTVYLVLFDINKGDLLYIVEFKKDGDAVTNTLVWRKEVPCEGTCA